MSQLALFSPAAPESPASATAGAALELRDLLPGDGGYVFGWAFDQIGEAEALIDQYREAHPDRRALLGHAFVALCPRWEVFGRRNPALIRAHMRELLDRIVQSGEKADLAPGTAAEVCSAMEHVSQAAPLKHDFAVAYHVAFIDALGEERAREILGDETVRRADQDREEHRKAEIYSEVRHQMRDEDRGKAWRERIR